MRLNDVVSIFLANDVLNVVTYALCPMRFVPIALRLISCSTVFLRGKDTQFLLPVANS